MTFLWFLCATLPPLFHAMSNVIDQYVIREHTSGSPLLFLSFSGFICLPIAMVIALFIPVFDEVTAMQAGWIIVAAWLFSACCIPYVYAMEDADAHEFTPVFQTAPILVAILGWIFLGETLTVFQIMGGMVVIFAAAASMVDFKHFKFKARPFFLILLAMIFYAGFVMFLRPVALEMPWLQLTFWMCVGWTLMPIFISAVFPDIRRALVHKLIDTRGRVVLYSAGQEIADVAANAARTAALGFAAVPAAVTDLVGGLQVIFSLIISYVAARFIPHLFKFDLSRRVLAYKLICFVVMMVGLWMVIGTEGI